MPTHHESPSASHIKKAQERGRFRKGPFKGRGRAAFADYTSPGRLRPQLDDEIMQKMSNRMKISEKIGQYKKDNNVTILQVNRWEEIIQTRVSLGKAMGLDEGFTRDLLRLVHHESIQVQTKIMNKTEVKV